MDNLLLLEKVHLSFEGWFIRQFQQGLLPEGMFSVVGMRSNYLHLCWKEDTLWKEWCNNVKTEVW